MGACNQATRMKYIWIFESMQLSCDYITTSLTDYEVSVTKLQLDKHSSSPRRGRLSVYNFCHRKICTLKPTDQNTQKLWFHSFHWIGSTQLSQLREHTVGYVSERVEITRGPKIRNVIWGRSQLHSEELRTVYTSGNNCTSTKLGGIGRTYSTQNWDEEMQKTLLWKERWTEI